MPNTTISKVLLVGIALTILAFVAIVVIGVISALRKYPKETAGTWRLTGTRQLYAGQDESKVPWRPLSPNSELDQSQRIKIDGNGQMTASNVYGTCKGDVDYSHVEATGEEVFNLKLHDISCHKLSFWQGDEFRIFLRRNKSQIEIIGVFNGGEEWLLQRV